MISEERLSLIVSKFPGIFSNKKNRITLFKSRNKVYLIEETGSKSRKTYHVIEVKDDLSLKVGKTYPSLEEAEAVYATQINL